MEVIDGCNYRSDICTFRSRGVAARRAERCRRGSTGTNDLLYIHRAVIKEVKSRNKNLAMIWFHIRGL